MLLLHIVFTAAAPLGLEMKLFGRLCSAKSGGEPGQPVNHGGLLGAGVPPLRVVWRLRRRRQIQLNENMILYRR